MDVELELRLPWLPVEPLRLNGLVIRRGAADVLRFDDGVTLAVRLVDPAEADSPRQLLERADRESGPGTVVLIAGSVPGRWRPALRAAGQSWLDRSGTLHIDWPRLRLSADRATLTPRRRQRTSVPLQQRRAVIAQELVVQALEHADPVPLRSIAVGAGVGLSTASRLVSQLEDHGFVVKHRRGREVLVAVPDPRALAELLARRTSWRASPRLWGYSYGQNPALAAGEVSQRGGGLAVVTSRVAALFHQLVGTDEPAVGRVRLRARKEELVALARRLEVEPVSREEANLELSADPWGLGEHRHGEVTIAGLAVYVAHPVRIWCDLHDEQRGADFADQLWRANIERRKRPDGR